MDVEAWLLAAERSFTAAGDEHTLWRPRDPGTLPVTRIAGLINTRRFVRGTQLVMLTPALSERLGTLR